MIAEVIRDLGFEAVIEARPTDSDRGGWRADVLGIAKAGRRVAFEVQLAAMTLNEGRKRTGQYAADQIDCVWVSPRNTHWMSRLPSCHLLDADGAFVVDRGLGRFDAGHWITPSAVPLKSVVSGLLNQSIVATTASWVSESSGAREFWVDDPTLLVPASDARAWEAYKRERRIEAEQSEHARRIHQQNKQLHHDRQQQVLRYALTVALAKGGTSETVRVGVEKVLWNGDPNQPPTSASGTSATAFAIPIWAVSGSVSSLWAVVCPLVGHLSPGLGRSWKDRGVRVFAQGRNEALKLSNALRWPYGDIFQLPAGS